MSSGTQDINNKFSPSKKQSFNDLNNKMEPEAVPAQQNLAQLLDNNILREAVTNQVLQNMAEARNAPRNVCTWTIVIVILISTFVGTACILVTLQSYGFLPKYSDEKNLENRLSEKTYALGNCTTELTDCNKKLQVETLLPVVNEQFCTPILEQNDKSRTDYKEDLQQKTNELKNCKNEIKTLRDQNDALKDDKITLRGGLMEAEVKLKALVAHSEENGGKCEGWLCSGVKVLYDVVKDTVAEKKQSKQTE